ncbi:hypothetical protein [Desulfurella sp.]|uniref:hypothetical protein n=1 Tax=Desulfurella sp. TaxID=1962857 RepID=UPI00257BFD76|nr:hypothetical protein [Desulfurella sp.]
MYVLIESIWILIILVVLIPILSSPIFLNSSLELYYLTNTYYTTGYPQFKKAGNKDLVILGINNGLYYYYNLDNMISVFDKSYKKCLCSNIKINAANGKQNASNQVNQLVNDELFQLFFVNQIYCHEKQKKNNKYPLKDKIPTLLKVKKVDDLSEKLEDLNSDDLKRIENDFCGNHKTNQTPIIPNNQKLKTDEKEKTTAQNSLSTKANNNRTQAQCNNPKTQSTSKKIIQVNIYDNKM